MNPIPPLKPLFSSRMSFLRCLRHFSSVPIPGLASAAFGTSTFGSLLENCLRDKNLALGELIHSKVVVYGLHSDSFLATKLIGLYSACEELSLAESVLSGVPYCNVFLMNAMIRGYSINGYYRKALDFFFLMSRGLKPDSYTFSCLLKACASLSDLEQGKRIHSCVCELGFDVDLFVTNALIAMYAKCGNLFEAVTLFEKMPHRDIVSWNSMIAAYIQNGLETEAIEKIREMVRSGYKVDCVTVISSLAIPLSTLSIQEVHCFIVRNGYHYSPMIGNSLISAYGKCGRIREARLLFNNSVHPDKVTWNAIISTYAQNGCFVESLQLLQDMKLAGFDADVITYSGIISSFSQSGYCDEAMSVLCKMLDLGLKPDIITMATILPAVSALGYSGCCKEIHAYSYRNGLEPDRRIRNALLSVYSKCHSIKYAVNIFSKITNRDVISWSSMVVGYSQNGYFCDALDIFGQMIRAKTEPNPITITSVLSACSGLCNVKQGKEVHLWALKNDLENHTYVGSALIDMYAKCGRIGEAQKVFDLMEEKNVVGWNSLIAGYAVNGLGGKALENFSRVETPDHVSFLAALSACRHGGLIDEGIKVFNSMKNFNVCPGEGHYACMVDMLGRSGRLEQALDLINKSPSQVSSNIWAALLGSCRVNSNLAIGMYAGNQIIKSGCGNPGHYVLLSNLLADFGKWGDVEMMRKLMWEKGLQKGAGYSWV